MNFYSKYANNAIQTTTKEDILLKLFEGALFRLKKAMELNKEGQLVQANNYRSQALAIITELDSTLDRENGDPGLVENLDSLYAFMLREINASTLRRDFDRLQPVVEVLENLYQGWKDAVHSLKNSGVQQAQHLGADAGQQPESRVSATS